MKMIEMIKGAKKMVDECTNVKKGENVLIITDTNTQLSIAKVSWLVLDLPVLV